MKKTKKYRLEKRDDGKFVVQVSPNQYYPWQTVSVHESCVDAMNKIELLRRIKEKGES